MEESEGVVQHRVEREAADEGVEGAGVWWGTGAEHGAVETERGTGAAAAEEGGE